MGSRKWTTRNSRFFSPRSATGILKTSPNCSGSWSRNYGAGSGPVWRNGHLRRAADSGDISQSVFLKFLVRMADGKFEIDSAAKLKALLWTMARNRIRDLTRQERPVTNAYPSDFPDPGSSPSGHVAREELRVQFRERLSPELRQIHQWRREELTWPEIGQRLQQPSHRLRVRFAREVERITCEMGLDVSE